MSVLRRIVVALVMVAAFSAPRWVGTGRGAVRASADAPQPSMLRVEQAAGGVVATVLPGPIVQLLGHVEGQCTGVAMQGRYAYVGMNIDPRLVVVDVADPTRSGVVGRSPILPGFVEGVAISGTMAYVAAGFAGLRLIDVSDPTNPTEVGSHVRLWRYATGVAVSGTVAYVACPNFGLWVIDVADPANPTEMGTYTMTARDVAISDTVAYVAGDGLEIIDVADPTLPTQLGSFNGGTTNDFYGVAISGSVAYLAQWCTSMRGCPGLLSVDITDPRRPTQVGFYDALGLAAVDVALSATVAYVAEESGVRVVDIVHPASPAGVGYLSTWPVTLRHIAGSGDLICVTSTERLYILRYRAPVAPPTPTPSRIATIPPAPTVVAPTPSSTPTGTTPPTLVAPTFTATATPSPTGTIWERYLHGQVVAQGSGRALAGASIRLYRGTREGWLLIRTSATNDSGWFGFSISPVQATYRISEQNPAGYGSISARCPPGVRCKVVDGDTLELPLPEGAITGQFIFADAPLPP